MPGHGNPVNRGYGPAGISYDSPKILADFIEKRPVCDALEIGCLHLWDGGVTP
jgi:hypothetical protein